MVITDYVAAGGTLTHASFTAQTAATDTFTVFMPLKNLLKLATAATADLSINGYQGELQGLSGYSAIGTFAVPLYVLQQRVTQDVLADAYAITLTYTASP